MTKYATKLAGLTASLLALAATASADIKINDNLTVSGFLDASYQYNNPSPSTAAASSDRFNVDAAQVLFTTTFKPVTAVISLYFTPTTQPLGGVGGPATVTNDVTVMDAYFTYDAGNGVSITAGKFLSYLGYESYYNKNNPEISFADGDFLGAIPGYHEGVRLDYGDKEWAAGVAFVDSVYSTDILARKGDGSLKGNKGYEGYVQYKGVTDLTLWAGLAYDTSGGPQASITGPHSVLTWNIWAQYQINKLSYAAAEYQNKNGGVGNKGYNWLVLLDWGFTDKFSTAFRISGEKMKGGSGFNKFTVAPGYAVTSNLTVKAEVSYYKYKSFAPITKAWFYGIQGVYTF